jgi:hypothetical protein
VVSRKTFAILLAGFVVGAGLILSLDLREYWMEGESVASIAESNVRIGSHELKRASGGAEISGTVVNDGVHTWNPIDIIVEFEDEQGRVADVCTRQAFVLVEPRTTRAFKVVCEGDTPTHFATYDVRLGGGVRSRAGT